MNQQLTNDQIIEQWKRDADAIGIDLNMEWTSWVHARAMMNAVGDSPRAREHPEAFYLYHFVLRGTINQVILGIRRQVDRDQRAHSLHNLLTSLVANPDIYTLDECIKTFLGRADRWGFTGAHRHNYEIEARSLYAVLADASGTRLDAVKIQGDLDDLIAACGTLKAIADQYIAHRDRAAPDFEVDYKTLGETIEQVRALQRKYTRLFDGGGAGAGEPDAEGMRSFYRFAWLPESDA